MSTYLVTKVQDGKTSVKFVPDAKMYAFAGARCLPENISKKDGDVAESVKIPVATLHRWREEANPYFDEWVENYILQNSGGLKLLRRMLEDVGNRKALEGEFPFWKAMAIKHGIIQPDQANLNIVPVNLKNYDSWTPEQIEAQRNSLLQSLLPMVEGSGSEVVDAPEGSRPESHPLGAAEMPE